MMLILVTGGSCSGKSAFAEKLLVETGEDTNKYYIATMEAADEESRARVARHRAQRAGKGFITIEQARNVHLAEREFGGEPVCQPEANSAPRDSLQTQKKAALLECMSNLVANEMFGAGEDDAWTEGNNVSSEESGMDPVRCAMNSEETLADKICRDIAALEKALDTLIVVTNNVFEDGVQYEEGTEAYLRVLGRINVWLAERAKRVYEVVVGIPVLCKDIYVV